MGRRVLLCLMLAVFPHAASAQQAITDATLSGRVVDPQGAAITDARVSARNTATNIVADSVTDSQGRYRFAHLKIGPYEITVTKLGFAPVVRTVTLTAGGAFDVPAALQLEGVAATIDVSAAAPVLEAERSQIASTVSQDEARQLPLNGRNMLDLALLMPGVSPTNNGNTQLFGETSAVPGSGISVGSQRNISNNFIVDGLSANDDAAGLSGMPYGLDAIDEFQVVTSGGQAELGRALGGYVSVITKSGTNTLRGDAYDYERSSRWNAKNALSGTRLPMSQHQFGGSLGGPAIHSRTFYFSNLEERRLRQSGLTTISDENVAAINSRLAAAGYAGAPVTTGVYPNPVDSSNLLLKLDHQVSGADQLTVRYSLYHVTSQNSRGAGGLSAPSASAGLDNTDHAIAAGNTMTLGTRAVNETRAQIVRSNLSAEPSDAVGPAVNIAGVAVFGTLSGSPTARVNTLYQFVDNISRQAGSHALRAGADFLYNDDAITFPRASRGSYVFSSLANFLSGTYNNAGFTQAFGVRSVSQTSPSLGIYAQDEWKPGSDVTINAGIRYDVQRLETVTTDLNNVAPRLGLAWSPGASRRTVVRANAGVFFDRVPLRAVANALLSAGNTTDVGALRQITVSLSPAQDGAPAFPAILAAAVPSVTLVNFTTIDPRLQNPYSKQAGVEWERQMGDRATLSVGYQYLRGENLLVQINHNVPTCVASGSNNGCRPNPGYANNNQYSSAAKSNYHGLHASFVQRPTKWGSYRVTYTLSKSMNDVGENFFSSPIDPTNLSKDWGRSDDDQRHRLVLDGAVAARGFDFSAIAQYYSALPYNITSGVTTVQGTAGRPMVNGAFIPRNAGQGSNFFSFNARVSRTFPLATSLRGEVMVEVFNVTNRRNDLTRIGNFGAGTFPSSPAANFAQVTAVGDPRSVQLAMRVRF